MAEVQHGAGIGAHRSGDVEQQHERRACVRRPAVLPHRPVAARAHGANGRWRAGPRACRARQLLGAASARWQAAALAANHVTQRAPFVGGEGVEIAMTQALFRAEGDVRVQFVLIGFGRGSRASMRAARRAASASARRLLRLGGGTPFVTFGNNSARSFPFPVGIAPEKIEGRHGRVRARPAHEPAARRARRGHRRDG